MSCLKLPQSRHPEDVFCQNSHKVVILSAAPNRLSRDAALVARSRRTPAVSILPKLLGVFDHRSPNQTGSSAPQRRGGTCCSSSARTNLNGSTTFPFVIPRNGLRSTEGDENCFPLVLLSVPNRGVIPTEA